MIIEYKDNLVSDSKIGSYTVYLTVCPNKQECKVASGYCQAACIYFKSLDTKNKRVNCNYPKELK